MYDPWDPLPPVQITTEYERVFSRTYMWRAPEYGDRRMFFTIADGEEMRVYKETRHKSNDYELYLSFESPSSNPDYNKFASPEPFIFDGHSYVTFMTSSCQNENALVPAEIWIARIDSLNPVFRMVSEPTVSIRTDPEAFESPDSLLVYYSEVENPSSPDPVYRIRKCETGFGKEVVTAVNDEKVDDNLVISPNPFSSHFSVSTRKQGSTFFLTNISGHFLWSGENPSSHDFSGLSNGLYFLREGSGKTTCIIKN